MSYQFGPADPEQRIELVADRRDDEPAPTTGRGLTVGAALLVMILFAGGLWFAYVEGTRRSNDAGAAGDVPLIRADARPIKVKPIDPGGMPIPDRTMLIYNSDRQITEHLLAPPEEPLARPTSLPVQAAAPAAAAPQSSVAQGKTAAPMAAEPTPAPRPTTEPPTKLVPAAPKSEAAKVRSPKTGGIRLQLGSVRSEDAARQEWGRIKRHNPDLLGHLSANAIRADLGEKGVYFRIQAGPVSDLAAADRICSGLKQRNIGCIIVR